MCNTSIYLDYNATTPIAPCVSEAMIPYLLERFGNPSSTHIYGFETQEAIRKARSQVALLLDCCPEEIVFTGCATESNNLAIMGTAFNQSAGTPHIITSSVEHPAVIEVCRFCQSHGASLTILPVDANGTVNPDDVNKAIQPGTTLITIMHANNEVGTIQPIREIGLIAREHGITFHTDAAQSVGKIPVQVVELNADLLTVAAHKFYGPKGIGALFIRKGVSINRIQHGAGHEMNLRPGTENVIGIVGMGAACDLAIQELTDRPKHLQAMRDRLHKILVDSSIDIRLNGHPDLRIPNTLSLGFRNLSATDLLNELEDLAISAGAACHSPGQFNVSPVLEAMHVPEEYARGTLRFSTGIMTTEDEIDRAGDMILHAVQRLQT
jgi:cysteine desulfurase